MATLNLLDPLHDKIETYGLRVTNAGQGLLICAAEAGGTDPHSVVPSWDFHIRPSVSPVHSAMCLIEF